MLNIKHIQYTLNKKRFLVVVVLFILFINPVFSQSKKQLELKRNKLQTEIKKINKLLSKTKKSETNVLSQISDINKRIKVYQDIINTITQESKVYTIEINKNKKEIKSVELQLNNLKESYKKTVINSYKSKSSNSKLLFLLSAKDFLQAYKRLQYMNQIADFRKKQANKIILKKDQLLVLNDSLLLKKKVKDNLIKIQLEEREVVDSEKAKKEILLQKVKKQEKKYLAQIKNKQKLERKYDDKLKKQIVNVIKKSNKKTGKKSSGFILTKEAKKLASSFVKNKGKLPAPVEKGYVSRYFGERRHEVLKKLSVRSSGWYYTTSKNAKARAVFKGVVKAIMVDKKTKVKTVIVQHGNYMTVYSNLENLLVAEGDKVSTKQDLGTVHTNTTTGKTIIKFALWKNAKAQNPHNWMFK